LTPADARLVFTREAHVSRRRAFDLARAEVRPLRFLGVANCDVRALEIHDLRAVALGAVT
jgi:hypothetical protein